MFSRLQKDNPKTYKLHCLYCRRDYISKRVQKQKFCSRDCYARDRFFKDEDTKEILDKIIKREPVDYIPKWLEELLFSYIKSGESGE